MENNPATSPVATRKRKSFNVEAIDNLIDGVFVPPTTKSYLDVTTPHTGEVIARVALSARADVDNAVHAGSKAFSQWSSITVKERAKIMFRFQQLVEKNAEELADLIVKENGKTKAEALAEVAKGNETVEWACSIPQVLTSGYLEVSRGVTCKEIQEPLGVVACIVPFNFPFMVPFWTLPIALVSGNCVILKPSEKVPLTMHRTAQLLKEAGVPAGVFQIVNGAKDAVEAICDHKDIKAVSFVGSSKVAELVYQRCRSINKRVLALGGAKNHLVALPDCDLEMAASDIVASFGGCAGQRCMAASVLLLIGEQQELLRRIIQIAASAKAGSGRGDCGAIIDEFSRDRIIRYIDEAEKGGAKLLLDGRSWSSRDGYWVGPTIILHSNPEDAAMKDEIFGPVLSVYQCSSAEEAIKIENANPYGNAACIYTSVGKHAEFFEKNFRAGMIGVNIGIPVPREPFSFGGLYGTMSKFGDFDITGKGGLNFFTNIRKVTTKWSKPGAGFVDLASFK